MVISLGKIKFNDLLPTFLPLLLFIVTFILCFIIPGLNVNILGLNEILGSLITFTSIIIGVLIALFGIIVTLSETDIMQEIRDRKGDRSLFRYSIETLISNFVLLLLSILFQSLIYYKDNSDMYNFINFYFYVWISLTVFVLFSSARTIYYLLMISFNQNNINKRAETTTLEEEESENLRDKYSDN